MLVVDVLGRWTCSRRPARVQMQVARRVVRAAGVVLVGVQCAVPLCVHSRLECCLSCSCSACRPSPCLARHIISYCRLLRIGGCAVCCLPPPVTVPAAANVGNLTRPHPSPSPSSPTPTPNVVLQAAAAWLQPGGCCASPQPACAARTPRPRLGPTHSRHSAAACAGAAAPVATGRTAIVGRRGTGRARSQGRAPAGLEGRRFFARPAACRQGPRAAPSRGCGCSCARRVGVLLDA